MFRGLFKKIDQLITGRGKIDDELYDELEELLIQSDVGVHTARRLHTRTNLMEELKKVSRVVQRELGRPADEVLLVLDATIGQNAVNQAKSFAAALPLTGIALAKLDGTARGGVVITVKDELGIPIKLVGTGEKPADLDEFRPEQFVAALFE